MCSRSFFYRPLFFFFNDTATTEIYTLSLHDALPISGRSRRRSEKICRGFRREDRDADRSLVVGRPPVQDARSEEHTSELQSQFHLVCRLLLEKKKKKKNKTTDLTSASR